MTLVRNATAADAEACAAIYAPYVDDTAVTFETDAPTADELAIRIATAQRLHAWLVLEDAKGGVVGYAYARDHNVRAAYRWSCEASVYLQRGLRRSGAGRALYSALLDRLTQLGFRRVTAGMTLPNEASVGLHRALGFVPVGTFESIGFKAGAWHDVAWMQRALGDGATTPPEGSEKS